MNEEELLQDGQENANETKAEKFQRLGVKRMNKILKDIEGLSNLSGSNYEYTDEQVEKMFSAIENATALARQKFKKEKKKETDVFTF